MALTKRGSAAYEAERVLRTIFKRCLDCPDDQPPCPPCASNQICSLTYRDCNSCAHAQCVANPSYSPPPSSGPNVGAIAGGVVGGIALIGIVVFLVWFLWIRKRRAEQEAEAEEREEDEIAQQKAAFQNMLHDAASVRTRGSFANSILSRASNVIQIAFIPGVTTRNGSSQTSMLAASPVPPIPAARGTPRSPLGNDDDAIFFRPGDIRDSSYSGHSSVALDRRDTQFSFGSRASSVNHSVYHDSLTIQPVPATQAARGMARMVSVKSSPSTPPTDTPESMATSASEYLQFSANLPAAKGKPVQILMPAQGQRGPLQSQGSFGKANQIMLGGKGKGRFPVRAALDVASAAEGNARYNPAISSPLRDANTDTEDDEEEHARARKSLLKTSPRPAQQPLESPFRDEQETSPQIDTRADPYASMSSTVNSSNASRRGKSMGGLSAVIEEATRKASSEPDHDGLGGKRESSPFSDSNKVD